MQKYHEGGYSDDWDVKTEGVLNSEMDLSGKKRSEGKPTLSANQLAAKALQLRMNGEHQEAENLS
ncbi:hypothetical protein Ancab_013203, partial [Ancistrocladus abbreviatus]